jgi:hypothetical protein
MTVELLYLPGCPNHGKAASLVRSVLQAEGLNTELRETPVIDYEQAQALGFPGSPTLLVNGRDIEIAFQSQVGFACRRYMVKAKPLGVPPRSWIEHAIRDAKMWEANRS